MFENILFVIKINIKLDKIDQLQKHKSTSVEKTLQQAKISKQNKFEGLGRRKQKEKEQRDKNKRKKQRKRQTKNRKTSIVSTLKQFLDVKLTYLLEKRKGE